MRTCVLFLLSVGRHDVGGEIVWLMETRSRILVPVKYAAWLSGDLGRRLERDLIHSLGGVPGVRVKRVAGGFLVDADEDPGPFVAAVGDAVEALDEGMRETYPMLRREMGRIWGGSLQVVFPLAWLTDTLPCPVKGPPWID